jgi:hypothetical protein
MPGKRMWKWLFMLAALLPMGCQSFCDRWAPCHPAAPAYGAYPPAAAGCVPCCPAPPQCCPPTGYQPSSSYQQGWAVPQTRLSPNCCD